MSLAVAMLLVSCSKNGDDPSEETKDPEQPVATYYFDFKYNGTAYIIAGDETCIFTRRGEDYIVMTGSDAVKKTAITVSITLKAQSGVALDIYASSPYVTPNISILFTEGDTLAEENFHTDDITQAGKIGKLTFTEVTDERLTGTFSCRTTNGEITDGKFVVKAKKY